MSGRTASRRARAATSPESALERVVVLQNPRWGGAERSLIESLVRQGLRPFLVCPEAGEWGGLAAPKGWRLVEVPRPPSLETLSLRSGSARFDRHRIAAWLAAPWAALGYAFRVHQAVRQGWQGIEPGHRKVLTLGVKSHLLGFVLLPWWAGHWQVDVRDFMRPHWLRRMFSLLARAGWCEILANSRAVAADYALAQVVYPRIALARLPQPRQASRPARRIIAHVAFFAPYKGQDLFLDCAAAWLKAGLDAEFWLIGEAIYPAPEYAAYAEALRRKAADPGLAGRVHFLGGLPQEQVMEKLEQVHLLVHCTREPEPFGRTLIEALLCGCEVIAHRRSGACEVAQVVETLPAWLPQTPPKNENVTMLTGDKNAGDKNGRPFAPTPGSANHASVADSAMPAAAPSPPPLLGPDYVALVSTAAVPGLASVGEKFAPLP